MTATPPEPGYGLVMPFVGVQSKGGPYDDDAYAAGWEMDRLDRDLEHAEPTFAGGRYLIHTPNAAQADLVAMRHGFVSRVIGERDGWSEVLIVRAGAIVTEPISTWLAAAIPFYLGVLGEVLRDLEIVKPPARRQPGGGER